MLEPVQDTGQIVERIAALDIGKAEVVCCVRVPDPDGRGGRVQEVATEPPRGVRRLTGVRPPPAV